MQDVRKLLLFFFISIQLCSCAQSKNGIKKAYATYTIRIPGNIPVDRNGNEIPLRDTVWMIYVETTSQEISWSKAWMDGRTYSVIPTLIDSDHVEAGTLQRNNEKMRIRTSGTGRLWRLQLISAEKPEPVPVRVGRGEMLISGKYKNRKILQRIKSITELVALPVP
ncbi:MAG TPA: hypothetical protein VG847_00265 [Chitinophagaceae bacterium]|nr:hypothetical protein [Chitinophagaceae bacterium]